MCGDITEWTLSAYVRDAAMLGMQRAMIVLGHERSEEPGMKYMAGWMKPILKDTEVLFLDAGECRHQSKLYKVGGAVQG